MFKPWLLLPHLLKRKMTWVINILKSDFKKILFYIFLDGLDGDKPKKKKPKKDPLFSKKSKSDPNAPPIDRIPLPQLRDVDKMEKIKALREASKRVNLSPENLPSVCFYTLLNSLYSVTW